MLGFIDIVNFTTFSHIASQE